MIMIMDLWIVMVLFRDGKCFVKILKNSYQNSSKLTFTLAVCPNKNAFGKYRKHASKDKVWPKYYELLAIVTVQVLFLFSVIL